METTCHPALDQIAVRVESDALDEGRAGIRFDFPYPAAVWGKDPSDWDQPERHASVATRRAGHAVEIRRTIDQTRYGVAIAWQGDAEFEEVQPHSFLLRVRHGRHFEFTCQFVRPGGVPAEVAAAETFEAARTHWNRFWRSGGAVDFSGSTDPRAPELERRVVLSRYLTAIQCAGSLPPQE